MIQNFIYSFLLRISTPIFGVVNFMLIVRLFDKEEVGVWVLYMTILGLVEVLKNGFIKNATIMLLNKKYQSEPNKVLTSSFLLNSIVTGILVLTIALVVIVFNVFEIYELFGNLLSFFCIQLVFHLFFSHFEYFLSAKIQFRKLMFAFVIRNFVFFVFLMATFVWFQGSIELPYLVLFQTVGLLASVLFLARIADIDVNFDPKATSLIKEIVQFGKFTFATNASSTLFRSTDHYMLAALLGNSAVASYSVALRITNLVDLPSSAAAEVLFPLSVKSENKKELYEKSVGYILAFVILASIVIYIFCDLIVDVITGGGYRNSVDVLKVTLAYGLILPFLRQFGTMIDAMGLPKINFYVMFTTFLLNLVFNYLFISEFGLLGAAYGTLVSYLLSVTMALTILRRKLLVDPVNIVRNCLGAFVALPARAYKLIRK